MDNSKTITTIIKTSIAILFAVFFIVLLAQYISIAQLNAKNERLDSELQTANQQYDELTNQYNDIANNYDDYVEDYVRENYDYGYEGEIKFND